MTGLYSGVYDREDRDHGYLSGSQGELTDPCYGLFTFRITTGQSQQDLFVSFLNRAVLFSSFRAALPLKSLKGNPVLTFHLMGAPASLRQNRQCQPLRVRRHSIVRIIQSPGMLDREG